MASVVGMGIENGTLKRRIVGIWHNPSSAALSLPFGVIIGRGELAGLNRFRIHLQRLHPQPPSRTNHHQTTSRQLRMQCQ